MSSGQWVVDRFLSANQVLAKLSALVLGLLLEWVLSTVHCSLSTKSVY
ncbi:MAG: hypothetical protein LBG72_04320 [Spirochaetaceae bacterium]|nr:hypothetical protein [Spirochaetaceae bacterium]